MDSRSSVRALVAALALAATVCFAAPISVKEAFELPEAQVEASIADSHPSIAVAYAKRLFDEDRKDDAVTWFYIGQLRYRFHLLANPDISPDGDPALMASLNATIGQAINEWAGGSPDGWMRSIDKALAWDASHGNAVTSQQDHAAEWAQVRSGLKNLRAEIEKNGSMIRETRAKNGLENR
jgi:hypothetical protein